MNNKTESTRQQALKNLSNHLQKPKNISERLFSKTYSSYSQFFKGINDTLKENKTSLEQTIKIQKLICLGLSETTPFVVRNKILFWSKSDPVQFFKTEKDTATSVVKEKPLI